MATDDLEVKRQMDSSQGDRVKGIEAPILFLPAELRIDVKNDIFATDNLAIWKTPSAVSPPLYQQINSKLNCNCFGLVIFKMSPFPFTTTSTKFTSRQAQPSSCDSNPKMADIAVCRKTFGKAAAGLRLAPVHTRIWLARHVAGRRRWAQQQQVSSAVLLQAWARSQQATLAYEREIRAIVHLQQWTRLRSVHRQYEQVLISTVLLQRLFGRQIVQRQIAQMTLSASHIQSLWRSHLDYQMHSTACTIQAPWRKVLSSFKLGIEQYRLALSMENDIALFCSY